jgi:hypothetical protein
VRTLQNQTRAGRESGKVMPIPPGGDAASLRCPGKCIPSMAFSSARVLGNGEKMRLSTLPMRKRLAPAVLAALGVAAPARADILHASNLGNNTTEKFTSGGVGWQFTSGLSNPQALAFDSAATSTSRIATTQSIEKFTTGGVGSVFASTGVSSPHFLAFTTDAGVPLALPEPASLGLLAVGTLALLRRRPRRA